MGWWRSAPANCSKFWRLSWSERWLLIQALLLLPLTALAIRLLGFKTWQTVLCRLSRIDIAETPRRGISTDVERIEVTARMVRLAARRGIVRPNCLNQSCVLWWLLRRHGIQSDLRIGVRRQENQFEAHAWVEREGVVISDDEDVHDRFSAFDRALVPASVKSQ